MRTWLEFPVALPIRTLLRLQIPLYSHSNQQQNLNDDVHRWLSLYYHIRMFLSLFGYTLL